MLKAKKPIEEETPKKKKKKIRRLKYKKQQCAFVYETGRQCRNLAVGKSTLCKKHGGNPVALETTMNVEQTKQYLQETVLNNRFKPDVHPLAYIDYSREGLSEVEIAAKFGVSVHSMNKWVEKFEQFALAHEIGTALHEAWWLEKGKEGLNSRHFNTPLFKFLTGNKLGYSEKIENKNLNINTHGVLLVPGKVTDDEWEQENIQDAIDIN